MDASHLRENKIKKTTTPKTNKLKLYYIVLRTAQNKSENIFHGNNEAMCSF